MGLATILYLDGTRMESEGGRKDGIVEFCIMPSQKLCALLPGIAALYPEAKFERTLRRPRATMQCMIPHTKTIPPSLDVC